MCEVKFGLKLGLRPKFGSDFRLSTFDLAEVDLTHCIFTLDAFP